MKFGITPEQKLILDSIFSKYLADGAVLIYGSRVKGNYTNISDVDLVIKNNSLDKHQLASLIDDIEESDFPFLCDIQLFENINNLQLKDHIERLGQVFYIACLGKKRPDCNKSI